MILLLRWLLRALYRFSAWNVEVLRTPGPVLLLPNHVSWWDWLLIGVCLEEDWKFVTSSTTARVSWVHRRLMVNRRTFPIDINSPYAVRHMAAHLQQGGRLVLFPEGRISRTGSLMKLFDGTGFLISKTRAKVITAYLRGARRLPFSGTPIRKAWFPRLSAHFSAVLEPPTVEGLAAARARRRLTNWLRDQMIRQQFETEMRFGARTLPEAILAAARRAPGFGVLQDLSMKALSYRALLTAAEALAGEWAGLKGGSAARVGVLLPNVNALPATLLSLWAAGRVPAILNFSTGPAVLSACARVAGLHHIITSRAFLRRARIDLEPLRERGVQVIYLEDVRSRISRWRKLRAALRQWVWPRLGSGGAWQPDDAALVLFTSGSEGDPKGVELTHRNVLANVRQMLAVIDLTHRDRFFNALPLFHSFGLTVGLLLPLIEGVFVFLYPSPLHYRVVPSALYNLDATVFFGTNTFLAGYARKANPYDFRAVRYLFAGAEKVQERTAELWSQRFGVRILEGYGATECSPCISVNVPLQPRFGTAGRLLPGLEHRLEPVEGVAPDPSSPAPVGRLLVRGPNVMKGYVNPEANTRFQALEGWYDTGDIVQADEDGFLRILGRLKRFAKISGEMVSLSAVEDALTGGFPQYGPRFALAIMSKPDPEKGERLIAVTNEPRLPLEALRQIIRSKGFSNLAVPREVVVLGEIPRLGTGKTDYRALAQQLSQAS